MNNKPRKLLLMGLAAFLTSGCTVYMGRQSDQKDTTPTSHSEPGHSSVTPTPGPGPVTPEDPGQKLDSRYDPGEIIPISAEQGQTILKEGFASGVLSNTTTTYAPEIVSYFFAHNHMTEQELYRFFTAARAFTLNTNPGADEDPKTALSTMVAAVVDAFAHINTDHLLANFLEVTKVEKYRNELQAMFTGYFDGEATFLSYIPDILRSWGKSDQAFERYVKLHEQNFGALSVCDDEWSYVEQIFEFIESDNSYILLRLISSFMKALQKNLTLDELTAIASFLLQTPNFVPVTEWANGYINENIVDFANHLGAAFKDFDLTESSHRLFIDNLATFAHIIAGIQMRYDRSHIIPLDDYDIFETLFISTRDSLDPRGLRVFWSFLGEIATDFTKTDAIHFGLLVEDEEAEPIDMKDSVEYIVDFYDSHYEVLPSTDKRALNAVFAALGISYDTVINRMREAAESGEFDSMESLLQATVVRPVQTRFEPELPQGDRYRAQTEYEKKLIFHQNDIVRLENLPIYLEENWSSRHNPNEFNWYGKSTLDTSEVGHHTVRFGFEDMRFEVHYYVTDPGLNVLQEETVRASTVKVNSSGGYDYLDATENFTDDGTIYQAPDVLKGYSSDEYGVRIRVCYDKNDCWLYSPTEGSFIRVSSAEGDEIFVPFSQLDTDELGWHTYVGFTSLTRIYNWHYDDESGQTVTDREVIQNVPYYFSYQVVETLSVPHSGDMQPDPFGGNPFIR